MLLVLFLSALSFSDAQNSFTVNGFTGTSGEIIVNSQTGASIFFWQFNAMNGNISTDTRPLVIWTGGGPGCSSEIGLLIEGIAPIQIDSSGNPVNNPASWHIRTHILAIDFPYDTGFSTTSDPSDIQNTTSGAVQYLYSFLTNLAIQYPSWFNRDVYWFGEDYSGHFIPAIASLILQNNLVQGNPFIKLKGIGLGSPWISAINQMQYYDISASYIGLLSSNQRNSIWNVQSQMYSAISNKNYTGAFSYWQNLIQMMWNYTGVSMYDVRTTSNQTYQNLFYYLNQPSVKKNILNVPSSAIWNACNAQVFNSFASDAMQSFTTSTIINLLSQIKVLIYRGMDDLYTNELGIHMWLVGLPWSQSTDFIQTRRSAWNVQGNMAGYVQTGFNLTYVQVFGAGHEVGINQPYALRDLAFRFMFNQGWN